MAVTSIFKPLFYSIAKVNAYIQAIYQKRVMHANNAIYESVFDDTCPNGSSQTINGHDHAGLGGGPFSRGVSWSEDVGLSHILGDEFTSTSLVINLQVGQHCRYRVSENMNGLFLEGWILYSAKYADIIATVYEGLSKKSKVRKEDIIMNQTYDEATEKLAWKKIRVPLGEGATNGVNMDFRVKSFEEDKQPVFRIHSMVWAEVYGVSYKLEGEKI